MNKLNLKSVRADYKYNFKKETKSGIVGINGSVILEENKIKVFYSERLINECGFNKILKVEVYRGSRLIWYDNKILGFKVEFPIFLSDGTYEIRATLFNQKTKETSFVINTFDFFKPSKFIEVNSFVIKLEKQNKNLVIIFNKKFSSLDLSELSLSNIMIFDSKNNKIKNFACKMWANIDVMNFVVLDVFNDENEKKFLPKEIYTFSINYKDINLKSSFSFEYENIDIYVDSVVDDVNVEILGEFEDVIKCKVYIKFSELLFLEDYNLYISNIKNKFLYYKYNSSLSKDDVIVFECDFKKQDSYFELSISKDDNLNIVRFDYFYNNGNIQVAKRSYFEFGSIFRNLSRYDLKFKSRDRKCIISNKVVLLGIADKYGQVGVDFTHKEFVQKGSSYCVDDYKEFLFENVNIHNKSSRIYTIELENGLKESFLFSPSIGVKFITCNYELKNLDNNKVSVNTKELGCNFKITYNIMEDNETRLDIINSLGDFRIPYFDNVQVVNLNFYNEDNKVYRDSVILTKRQIESYVKASYIEKIRLDLLNYLNITDKRIFEDFEGDFYVDILDNNRMVIQSCYVDSFNEKFQINFDKMPLVNEGFYYLKFRKKDKFKLFSFFVSKITCPKNIFIKDIDKKHIKLLIENFKTKPSFKEVLKMYIYIVIDDTRNLFIEQTFFVQDSTIDINFLQNELINNTEYIIVFKLTNDKEKVIRFTYLGTHTEGTSPLSEESVYELNDLLFYGLDEDIYENLSVDYDLDIGNDCSILEDISDNDIQNNCLTIETYDQYIEKLFKNMTLDEIGIIIRKAYSIFLDKDIDDLSSEVILWKNLIKDKKIDLSYLIEVFVKEYMTNNNYFNESDFNNEQIWDKIVEFLNIKELSLKELSHNNKNYDVFIDKIFENIKVFIKYKDIEPIFDGNKIIN